MKTFVNALNITVVQNYIVRRHYLFTVLHIFFFIMLIQYACSFLTKIVYGTLHTVKPAHLCICYFCGRSITGHGQGCSIMVNDYNELKYKIE